MPVAAQEEWTQFIRICWMVLIPVGFLLAIVLYRLLILLQAVSEFLSLARYEITPIMKDVRLTAQNMETLSRKAVNSVQTIESGVAATGPAVRTMRRRVVTGVQSLMGGLRQAFRRS